MTSRLTAKSTQERNAYTVMLDIVANLQSRTAAGVAADTVTDTSSVKGQEAQHAVLAANGRATMIVREDMTQNCVCA